jgi:hypothetical protein
MLATVFFGLACALSFMPSAVALSYLFSWSTAFRLILWLYLAVYGFLLTRWAKVRFVSIIFPLLIGLFFALWGYSTTPFLLLAIGIFSWIRSGICFQRPLAKMLATELIISLGGSSLVAYFAPHSPATWAMGLWMFFLVQSLYFMVVRDTVDKEIDVSLDPFEEARRHAEDILSVVRQ